MPGQGLCRLGAIRRNSGSKAGTHHECDISLLYGNVHTQSLLTAIYYCLSTQTWGKQVKCHIDINPSFRSNPDTVIDVAIFVYRSGL